MPVILAYQDFPKLFDALQAQGWTTVGPTVRDGAIVLDKISSVNDLPLGLRDQQAEGSYRLRSEALESNDDQPYLFGYNNGPVSAKKFLHASRAVLWEGDKQTNPPQSTSENGKLSTPVAFLGLHPCDLQAIFRQDEVLLRGPFEDALYAERRRNILLIVVNCTHPGATCFCSSMQTGPRAIENYDLAITELKDEQGHRFLLEAGSHRGDDLLKELPASEATSQEIESVAGQFVLAEQHMGRQLDLSGLREILINQVEHPHWETIAKRCLGCGNCTSVCPTCFCVTIEDSTSLNGQTARRERRWDSCFTLDFSYIHGGSVRPSAKSRYRQWMMHKLATWNDQFGTPGCVGCGRCITWCPVGIDITAEAAAIREQAKTTEVRDGNN